MLAQIYVVEGPCTIVRDVTRYGGAYYRPEVCTSNFCFSQGGPVVIKSILKVHDARNQLSLRRLPLPVTGLIAMLRAELPLSLYTPFISPLTLIRGQGDHGELVSALEIWKANLRHAPWSTLRSAENDFYVQGIAAGVGMEFYIGGSYVAQFVGANLGAMVAAGFNGWIDWS